MAKSLLEVFQDLERRIVLEMKRPDGGDELALIAPRLRLLSNELDRWKVPSPGKKAAVSPVVGAAGNAAAKVVTSTKKAVEKSGSISNKLVSRIQRSKESEEAAKKLLRIFSLSAIQKQPRLQVGAMALELFFAMPSHTVK